MKTAEGLRKVFNRMGFNDQEIVALSGAHALGRCHVTASGTYLITIRFSTLLQLLLLSGYVGPWTPTPEIFNNAYFVLLKNLKWTVNPKASKFQYEDESKKLMMLPSDLVLIEDPQFKTYVDIYASDSKKFFADFADAFSRLLVLLLSSLLLISLSSLSSLLSLLSSSLSSRRSVQAIYMTCNNIMDLLLCKM